MWLVGRRLKRTSASYSALVSLGGVVRGVVSGEEAEED